MSISSSEEPEKMLESSSQANKPAKEPRRKKVQTAEIINQNPTRSLRKCRYTGTYSAKNWDKQPQQIHKNVKLRDRLIELEKLISQNKDTGISLDYDENEAKVFFEALGIRRINSPRIV